MDFHQYQEGCPRDPDLYLFPDISHICHPLFIRNHFSLHREHSSIISSLDLVLDSLSFLDCNRPLGRNLVRKKPGQCLVISWPEEAQCPVFASLSLLNSDRPPGENLVRKRPGQCLVISWPEEVQWAQCLVLALLSFLDSDRPPGGNLARKRVS